MRHIALFVNFEILGQIRQQVPLFGVTVHQKTLAKGGYDHESKIWSWNGPNGKSIEDDLWERRENVSLIVIPTTKFEFSSAPGTR